MDENVDITKTLARACVRMLLETAHNNHRQPEDINLCLQIEDENIYMK